MLRTLSLLLLLCSTIALQAQSVDLTGSVTDLKNAPLAGATVHLLNTDAFATTDSTGRFTLPSGAGTYFIQCTAVGFATVEKPITAGVPALIQMAENFTQLEAVVVTAQKREEELQSVPASISALSARQIQEYRIWNSKDITAIVPNLYSANPGDGRNVTSLRGITSTSYDPSVATYIDGVNQFGLDTYIAQLFDVERIEVLRGPQGTLYGRNAMGGVINIITRQPTNITNGFAEVTVGNADQQRYTAAVRTPLIKNKLFLGVAGIYDHSGGFYSNQFNGSKFDNRHSFTGNYYLKYLAGKRWALTLNLKHNENRNRGAFPLTFRDAALANPFHLDQNGIAMMIDNIFNTSLAAVYSGNKFNFSSQTSWQSNYRYYETPIDGDFTSLDAVSIVNNYGSKWNNVKVLTQEFKFSSPATTTSPLQWTAGTYFFYQNSPVKQAIRYGKDATLYGVPDSLFSTVATTKSSSAGAAFFGQATYAIVPALRITAGLRYDFEHKKQNVLGEYQHDPDPTLIQTRTDTSASVSFHAVSPKLTASWQPGETSILYASWSRGYRTGGLTPLSSDPSQPPLHPYQPEFSSNFETGAKNSFMDNRLRVNFSLFYITVSNAQIPRLILPDAITITSNAGSLISKGAELELSATPLKGLQVDYNLGINDARFKNKSSNGDFAGKHQIFTPPVTSMLALQYTSLLGQGGGLRLVVRGEWMYLGKKYFNYTADLIQNPTHLFNARAGVSLKGFELTVWGRNLADKKYIDYAYDFGVVHLGNPRNFGVTLRKNF